MHYDVIVERHHGLASSRLHADSAKNTYTKSTHRKQSVALNQVLCFSRPGGDSKSDGDIPIGPSASDPVAWQIYVVSSHSDLNVAYHGADEELLVVVYFNNLLMLCFDTAVS